MAVRGALVILLSLSSLNTDLNRSEHGTLSAPSAEHGLNHLRRDGTKAYLVGGGIASLASAAYLIRDGGIPAEHISILEETNVIGGSLDGEGSPEHNYVIRGGRMFTEEAYTCMFDLLSFKIGRAHV